MDSVDALRVEDGEDVPDARYQAIRFRIVRFVTLSLPARIDQEQPVPFP